MIEDPVSAPVDLVDGIAVFPFIKELPVFFLFHVLCDTRLAECFDLSPEKLKGTEQEQRKQQLKQEEKRIVL